jgi:arylsulfatase A-like enzyme
MFSRRLLACLLGVLLSCAFPNAGHSAAKPSIILILTDDMETGLVEHMPNLKALIVEQGATFARAYVNNPLCCPSRATILTGRYAHNTGVTLNSHKQFYEAGNPDRTVAVWLKAAGYHTALIGKYLNGYPRPAPETYVPPGWDHWTAHIDVGRSLFYNYRLNEGGRLVDYGKAPGDYSTDLYADRANAFIKEAVAAGSPFFLMLSVHAPHVPSTPAPRHASLFPTLMAPRPASFDEADVNDKPSYIRNKALASPTLLGKLDETYRQRVRSVQAVDEALRALVDTLDASGRLAQTYLVLASDNGLLHGQHRVDRAKGMPYEEVVRIPLYVRGPGIRHGLLLEHMAGNVDLAPTFAEWAGAEIPEVDGRSFAPLLRDGAPGPEEWRQAFPLTYEKASEEVPQPDWRGVRTRDYVYVEYGTGEREMYDMRTDPFQLQNAAASADPALLARLSQLTAVLNACKTDHCRQLEDAPVGP